MQAAPDPSPVQNQSDLAEYSIKLSAGLALAIIVLFFILQIGGRLGGSRDLVAFWATGRQLADHLNPYDSTAIAAIEHAKGLDPKAILVMRNPPWALPLVWPLGFLGLQSAALLWSLLLLGCLLLSVRLIHRAYGNQANRLHWLVFSFTPALICLTMGQSSLLPLLGLTLFLDGYRSRPFFVGAALWLCALKLHLFLPFGIALALWIVTERAWKVLAGAATALAFSIAAAWLLDPRAWLEYGQLMRSADVQNDYIPCLACALRAWTDPRGVWVQYLPAALACLWAMVWFWRRRASWDWKTDGSLLMLASLVAAPYCWHYDQILAAPALVEAAYGMRSRNLLTGLALAIVLLNMEMWFVQKFWLLWFWTTPAWLAWYLYARAASRAPAALPQDAL